MSCVDILAQHSAVSVKRMTDLDFLEIAQTKMLRNTAAGESWAFPGNAVFVFFDMRPNIYICPNLHNTFSSPFN